MPIQNKNDVLNLTIDEELKILLADAKEVYRKNFSNDCWLGRCIFLSWYCSLGDCDFCYRSTQKHKIKFPENARRRKESIYTEAIIAKALNWKLEFLTGGYGIYDFEDLIEIAKVCSEIYQQKIWLNFGVLSRVQLEKFKPYVEGVVASVETLEPKLHKKVAPGKPLKPFQNMLNNARELGLKRSMTIVLGLGEPIKDYKLVKEWIKEYGLERITYYSLRPVKGTPYNKGPDPEYVAKWVAKTRIDFPKIEIVVGTAETRILEIHLLLEAGANAITKIPATKLFGTTGAEQITGEVRKAERNFVSELEKLPKINWETEVNKLSITDDRKKKVLEKIEDYKKNRLLKKFKGFGTITIRTQNPC